MTAVRAALRIFAAAAIVLIGTAFAADGAQWPHELYVWQRLWTPSVSSALSGAAAYSSGWRVLVAESASADSFRSFRVDWTALARTQRPVVAVIRIDGQIAIAREPALFVQVKALMPALRSHGIAGVEIDYDCGVARLGDYAAFLRRLRADTNLPRLSVTALPAWLDSPELDSVLAEADEAVLQVHAVRTPQSGLFDHDVAQRWIAAFDRRDPKPYRVALPDYGTRVVEDGRGRILSVESETPRLTGDAPAMELMASPSAVAQLLRQLRADPPKRLEGFVWFRLPTEDDARIWSSATLGAVIEGRPLTGSIGVRTRPGAVAGLSDIVLVNEGDADAALPGWVDLAADCRYADGVNGYSLGKNPERISLMRLQTGLLRAHHERVIGWMRCSGGQDIHVRP